jgi:hypothetical protein
VHGRAGHVGLEQQLSWPRCWRGGRARPRRDTSDRPFGLSYFGNKVTGTSVTESTGKPLAVAALRIATSLGPS